MVKTCQRSLLSAILFLMIATAAHAQFPPPFGFSSSRQTIFAQVANGQADGGRLRAAFIFSNASAEAAGVAVAFKKDDGSPLPLGFEGSSERAASLDFLLSAGESRTLRTDGLGALVSGYAVVSAGRAVSARMILAQLDADGHVLAETGADATAPATQMSVPVQVSRTFNTGLALVSVGKAANLTLRLYDASGRLVQTARTTLAADQHRALFVSDQLFPSLTEFTGALSISSTSPIVVMAVRQSPLSLASVSTAPDGFAGNGGEVISGVRVDSTPVISAAINPVTNQALVITDRPKPISSRLGISFAVSGGGLSTVDLSTGRVGRIDVGDPTPLAVVVNQSNNTALVAAQATTTAEWQIKLLVVDLATNRVRAAIGPLVSFPRSALGTFTPPRVKLAINPQTNVAVATTSRVYSVDAAISAPLWPNTVYVVDLARNVIRKTWPQPFSDETNVVIHPGKNAAILANLITLEWLDLESDRITRAFIFPGDIRRGLTAIGQISINPDKDVVVAETFLTDLQIPPVSTSRLTPVDLSRFVPGDPLEVTTRDVLDEDFDTRFSLQQNAAANAVVFTRNRSNDILLVDWNGPTIKSAIPTGKGPRVIATDPSSNRILVGHDDGTIALLRLQ